MIALCECAHRSGLPSNTVGVVNLSGKLILDFLRPWTQSFKEECWNSRVDTTRILARACQQLTAARASSGAGDAARPQQLTYIATSAIGYYPTGNKVPWTEAANAGDSFFANMCAEIERSAAAAEVCDFPSCRFVLNFSSNSHDASEAL